MYRILLVCLLIVQTVCVSASGFTPGNIVIVRVGDGSAALSNASSAVYLDEYTVTGTLVQSVPLPTAVSGSNHALTLSGSAATEGALALSANGQYLSLAGFDTMPGLASVSSGSTNRTIARIDAAGNVNTSTGFIAGSAFVAGNFRSTVSNDGNEFWAAGSGGSTGGVWYVPFGSFTSTGTQIGTTVASVRDVNIFGGQLYFTTSGVGLYAVGTGLPTTTGQTETMLPGLPTSDSTLSPFSFVFLDESASVAGNDVLYVADNTATGGIYKFSLVGGQWVTNGNIASANGLTGLTGFHSCHGTTLFASGPAGVYTLTDVGGYNVAISGSYTQIVTGAANTLIHGIAFTPGTQMPSPPVVTIATKSNVSCHGLANGSITTSFSGGYGSTAYNWGGGITTTGRSNLGPNNYSVTVTDGLGCTASTSTTITEPAALVLVSDSITNLPCTGGSTGAIKISVSGGTGLYHYSWTPGNSTSQNISGLTAGAYVVHTTDSAGCVLIDTFHVSQSGSLTVIDTVKNPSCHGLADGAIRLTVSGGTPGYSYHWNNTATTSNISTLIAGSYTVTIADQAGCVLTLPISVSQPAALSVIFLDTNVSCYGEANGSATAVVSGGTVAYSYQWTGNISSSNNAHNLAPGSYTLTVTDHNGCIDTAHTSIIQPDSLLLVFSTTNDSSFGAHNGSIDLTVTGGTGTTYTYIWSNTVTTQNIHGLAAGNYCVTVTDQNGCNGIKCTSITQPSGVDELSWLDECKVYTTDGNIHIEVSTSQDVLMSTEMYDLSGHKVYQSGITSGTKLDLQIANGTLAAGCYIIRINSDKGSISKKIVIVK